MFYAAQPNSNSAFTKKLFDGLSAKVPQKMRAHEGALQLSRTTQTDRDCSLVAHTDCCKPEPRMGLHYNALRSDQKWVNIHWLRFQNAVI